MDSPGILQGTREACNGPSVDSTTATTWATLPAEVELPRGWTISAYAPSLLAGSATSLSAYFAGCRLRVCL